MLQGTAQAADWVEFQPCGYVSDADEEGAMVMQLAPNIPIMTINRRMVIAVYHMGFIKGVQCTMLLLSNGQRQPVAGNFEKVREALRIK